LPRPLGFSQNSYRLLLVFRDNFFGQAYNVCLERNIGSRPDAGGQVEASGTGGAIGEAMKTGSKSHRWQFKARFRRHAFGWKPQPAIKRVREAVSEIKKAARKDQLLAAEGAVSFLEKVSPALEHVDTSSGAIGTAVNRAVMDLVEIIAFAPADANTRGVWLERLFAAHAEDRIPYIERLADYWG